MLPHQKREVIEELAWHCEDPKDVFLILTEAEKAEICKRGYVTKQLWAGIEKRLQSGQALYPEPALLDLEAPADELLDEA